MLVLSEIELGDYPKDKFQVEQIDVKNLSAIQGREAEVIVCSRATAIALLDVNLPKLKLIQLTSAGFDSVPLKEYRDKSVNIANAANVYGIPIAETVVFGMLEFAKKLRTSPENRNPRLTRGYANYITELSGKTVVILGIGNIGNEIARRLSGFDMRVVGYARHMKEDIWFDTIVTERELLLNEVKKADYVISTLPDNENSRGFISEEFLHSMKSTAYFINVGRRKTIDEEALYRALKNKTIQGAALDMFERLPNPVTNKFRRLSNVIVWPGVAAISRETDGRLRKMIIKNLIDLEHGSLNRIIN